MSYPRASACTCFAFYSVQTDGEPAPFEVPALCRGCRKVKARSGGHRRVATGSARLGQAISDALCQERIAKYIISLCMLHIRVRQRPPRLSAPGSCYANEGAQGQRDPETDGGPVELEPGSGIRLHQGADPAPG